MEICKFEKVLSKIYKVNRNNFEEATNKDKNYIKLDKKGKNQYYVYCPEVGIFITDFEEFSLLLPLIPVF